MPSSYTNNLGIELPADGEQDGIWGDIVNENMDILDRAINGQVTLTLTGTSSTLTTPDGALANGQFKLLVLAGTPSGTHTITISPNDAQKIYFVRNTTAQSVVFTQGSGGNITIATGDSSIIYANGGGTTAALQSLSDHFSLSSVKITGGTIDGTVIGGTTAAAITGTTITGTTITHALGTALLPSITFTGDTNTGMWSPGADTLAFSGGGAERLRVTSTGLMGLGTVTPLANLHVNAAATSSSIRLSVADVTYVNLFANASGVGLFNIANGFMQFGTDNVERMRITATGSVGIGTTAPLAPLHVNVASGASAIRFSTLDVTYAQLFASSASTNLYSITALPLLFGTNNTERMRILATGEVGIGTATPTRPLHVSTAGATLAAGLFSNDTGDSAIFFRSQDTGLNSIIFGDVSVFNAGSIQYNHISEALVTRSTGYVSFLTGGANERLRITSNGSVGIGTIAPNTDLEVSSNTTATGVVTASITGTTMDVTALASGVVAVGDRVSASAGNVEWNTYITALGTGSGGVGTYTVNNSQTVASTTLYTAPAANSVLRLTNVGTAERDGQTIGGLEFFGSDLTAPGAGVKGYVALVSESTSPDYSMIFGTSDNIASTFAVERMRITSLGRLGIGSKSPLGSVHIQTTLNNQLRLQGGSTGDIGAGFISWFANDGTRKGYVGHTSLSSDTFAVWNDAATSLVFGTSAVETMRITATGNVGIGIVAPATKLDVEGDALILRLRSTTSLNSYMRFDGTGTSFPFIGLINGTGVFGNTDASPLRFNTNTLERMRITDTGDVGIGVTTPGAKLHVLGNVQAAAATTETRYLKVGVGRSGDGDSFIDLVGDATYTAYGLRIQRSAGANGDTLIQHRGTGTFYLSTVDAGIMVFQTASGDRLRLAGSGVVSIPGATTETRTLEVGTGRTGDGASIVDLVGDATYTDWGTRLVRNAGANGATVLASRGTGGILLQAQEVGPIVFQTSSVQRAVIPATGGLNVTGDAAVTTTVNVGLSRSADGQSDVRLVADSANQNSLSMTAYAGTNGIREMRSRGTGALQLVTQDAAPMIFTTAVTERVRVLATGEVGIGTSTPAERLTVAGNVRVEAATTEPRSVRLGIGRTGDGASNLDLIGDATYTSYGTRLVRNSGVNGTSALLHRGTGDLVIQTQEAASISLQTTGTERFRIDESGRIGIGAVPVVGAGVLIQSASNNRIRLQGATLGDIGAGFMSWHAQDGTRKAYIGHGSMSLDGFFVWNEAATEIRFGTTATERMRILATGEVGIGTSLPLSALHVNAAATSVSARLSVADVTYGNIFASSASVAMFNITAAPVVFGTSNTEQMRITAAGFVGLSNTGPIAKLDVTGNVVARGVIYRQQPAQTSIAAAATLTIAQLLTGIIQYTGALATLTLPTGTLIEGGLPATFPVDVSFDFSVINTGSGVATLGTATGLTLVGSMAVAAGASGVFRARKTALNVYTIYRIS